MKARYCMQYAMAIALVGITAGGAQAVTQDFAGPVAGTVIAGALPQGGSAPGTYFPGITVFGSNNGGGPHSVIIFDSNNPPSHDLDLGTPNQDFAGPGVGVGGEIGAPYPNDVAHNNLLIVQENNVDADNNDIYDDPDDEAGGSVIDFLFDSPVDPTSITLIDIDNETASVALDGDTLNVVVNAADAGDNSKQDIDLSGNGGVACIRVTFSSSGAVAQLVYGVTTATENASWGDIKQLFR